MTPMTEVGEQSATQCPVNSVFNVRNQEDRRLISIL